mgnify:FL=1
MTVVQNDSIADVKNDVAQECVNNIFSEVMKFDHYSDLAHDIAASIAVELKNRTFFTDDLELTQKQKDVLDAVIVRLVVDCKNRYLEKINEDERTTKIAQALVQNCRKIIDLSFSSVAHEINRGAIISGQAISASAASEKYNRIEFRYLCGEVTVPTSGVFISTNCIYIIKNSVEVSFNLKREPKIATVSENGKVTTAPFLIEAEQVQDGDKEVDEVLENVDDDSDENSDE